MDARIARGSSVRGTAALAAILLAGTAWPALAQTAPADPQTPPATVEEGPANPEDEIVVSGYRASLESSNRPASPTRSSPRTSANSPTPTSPRASTASPA